MARNKSRTNTPPKIWTKLRRPLICLAAAMGILALLADFIGISSHKGLGQDQVTVALIAAALLVICLVDRKGRCLAPIMACVVTYITLLAAEIIVLATSPRPKNAMKEMQGLASPDDQIGWTYTPNWTGYFDDGLVRVPITINSRGHRDDEPVESDKYKILLIGDSFAFGALLNDSERIDSQVEQLTGKRIDAYNAGQSGTGPPMILELFRRCDWFRGSDVFYLFFANDLSNNAQLLDANKTVVDGYRVTKTDSQGNAYTIEEIRKKIKQEMTPPSLFNRIRSTLLLDDLRRFLPRRYPPQGLTKNVGQGVRYTEQMRALATEREIAFHVVIIPSQEEVSQQEYSDSTRAFLREIRDKGIHAVEFLDELSIADYFQHDGHFNPRGARKVAEAIVQSLPPP